ncbi:MAG: hypothetical protein ACAI44_22655 [Candidatus Sericytochromatia bacterium]
MSTNPIMPKTFAAFVNPLKEGKNYTEGSDDKAGLSKDEAQIVRNDIQCSKVLTPEQKLEALARVDQALTMTQAAKAGDGKVDGPEMNKMLELACHGIDFQPLNRGSAAPVISLNGQKLPPTGLKSTFFSVAAGTCYAPKNTGVEGGTKDSNGKSLKPYTLDKYVAQLKSGQGGPSDYVAIAMDPTLYKTDGAPFKYGDVFRIPEIEKIKGVAPIYFAVVDNGGAFSGAKGGKVDICCDSQHTEIVNQSLSLHRIFKPDGQALNMNDLK